MAERNQIRRRKRKQKARRVLITSCIVGFTFVVIIFAGIISYIRAERQEAMEAERLEAERLEAERLEQERVETAKANVNEAVTKLLGGTQESYSEWFLQNYNEDQIAMLFQMSEDQVLTERECYDALGESIYVLKDRYAGYLANDTIAREHHIYLREGKTAAEAEITVAGDLCLAEDGFVLDYYDTTSGLSECISPEILEILNQSDIFYVNHEYCISDKGSPLSGKYYTFRANPERMSILEEMGTDIVSLANNHVYDYGEEALYDTVDLLNIAGIPYVGGGRDINEAKEPIYFIVNGMKIGFVAASNGERIKFTPQATETTPGILRAYDTTEYNEVIQKASKECDYLIAYIHWGTEDSNYLNEDQKRWGREFLNSGADIVVGGHPHVLQGVEYVDGKPIIYSLGDFWFNHETKYTGVLKLNITFDGLKEMSFVPCIQTGFTTQYISEPEKQQKLYQFLEDLSINVQIDENGVFTES